MEDAEIIWTISYTEKVRVSDDNKADKWQYEEKERSPDIDIPWIWGIYHTVMFIWV